MGDKLVEAILNSVEDAAFSNSVGREQLRPIIDVLVNRLRNSGMSDEAVILALMPKD